MHYLVLMRLHTSYL